MSFFSGRRRYVIAGLLTVGATAAAALSLRDNIPGPDRFWFMGPLSPFGASASSSMKPVELELVTSAKKSVPLKIPRAYIATISEPERTQQSFINLVVYLPDYLPRTLADKAGHQTQGKSVGGFRLRSPDEIVITLKPSVRGLEGKLIESIKGYALSGGEYRQGLEIYYHKQYPAGSTEPIPDKHSGFLIPIGRDDFRIRFVSSPKTGKMVGCALMFNLSDDVQVEASFPAEHLDEYEQIRKIVSELISRFLT
jgi:hypothetical protein